MIDVNGTRHQLILGRDDWMRAASEGPRKWEYDAAAEVVQLQGEVFTFRQSDADPLSIETRRGAARDQYGHWYWIDKDEVRIMARWAGASQPEVLYPPDPAFCPVPAPRSDFAPAAPPTPTAPERLAGLAVTNSGYLVAGLPESGSLLVLDLYSLDGGPLRISLPHPPAAVPFELAALPDGGLLVLDTVNKQVWVLDATLKPKPTARAPRGDLLLFQPQHGRPRREATTPPTAPISLAATDRPISIEPLPDGSFWVLDTSTGTDASTLWRYAIDGRFAPQRLDLLTSNLIDADADDLDLAQIRGHDIAYLPDRGAQSGYANTGWLYIADTVGNQAYCLRVTVGDPLSMRIERRYYPMRNFNGTALLSDWAQGDAYYHQGARWLPIRALPQMKYEEEATLILPPMDGRDPACVWHRLCVDACIPQETNIWVETRAADTLNELAWQPWVWQPYLYHRPTGSELPYYNLWSAADRENEDTGTWELLFQQTTGRYLQIRLTLVGNGRSTPQMRALRAHFPRFSYLSAYLPAIYQQDAASRRTVENFLANPEGIFTTIEGLVAQAQTLMDVRSAPPEAVDWLGGWLGLALEPGWTDYQRRLLIAQAPYFFLRRGTLPGLHQAILLVLCPELGPEIFSDDIGGRVPMVRIVERYVTRTQPGIVWGDPTDPELTIGENVLENARLRAHRFTVLVPAGLSDEVLGRVDRIVQLEKPAHTAYTIQEYWAFFRVGEARLGIDTVLGEDGRSEVFRLGQTALAEGYLGTAFPYDLTNRIVVGT